MVRRNYTTEHSFFADWFKEVLSGTTERKSVSIIFLDRRGERSRAVLFTDGWPASRKIMPWTDRLIGVEYIIEEIEFVVEKVECR